LSATSALPVRATNILTTDRHPSLAEIDHEAWNDIRARPPWVIGYERWTLARQSASQIAIRLWDSRRSTDAHWVRKI